MVFRTKTVEIIGVIAAGLGCRVEDVTEIVRRIREADLFVRETKSPQSPRATARHCANLFAAILSDEPARHAARGVENAGNSIVEEGSLKHVRYELERRNLRDSMKLLAEPHSFIDALEILIGEAACDPSLFEFRFNRSDIVFDTIRGSATIRLRETNVFKPLLNELPDGRNCDVTINYLNYKMSSVAQGELAKEMRMGPKTISQLGRVLARDSARE